MIGNTLGRYEITALLGKGGMGEVYRATDTSLNREVAIKVLPSIFSNDPERVARFEREATTLAKLQHTNIATIYGFEEDDDQRFLVMELVEGEELAERLERGPIPPEEAMLLAAQIAEGLEVAHNMGIVHRDLKPANLKITPNGDVKILDFGLARAFADEADGTASIEIGNSPTLTAAMTQAGVILGTAAYMSPEQARGKAIDKQADLWSFAVVFYEMLTADRLFGGETVSDSIGAILHRDPDLTQLPDVPPQIHTLLRRCLTRDKRQRLRDIGDARLDIEDAIAVRATTKKAAARKLRHAPWLVAGALAIMVGITSWLALTSSGDAVHKLATLGLPRNEAIDLGIHNAWPRIQFSPDGKQVVYIGGVEDNLFRRDTNSFDSRLIPGIEHVGLFTFSPDGLWIAYSGQGKLWKVALSGGAPIELCDTADGPGLAWGSDEIFFSRANGGGLWSVPVNGGQPKAISTLNDEREETSHRWPHVLPGGRHLLITIKTARIATFDDALIGVLSLETGEIEVLVQGGTFPQYLATGHILYGRDEQLFAVPFDLETLTVQGTPTRVLEEIDTVDVNGCAQYSLSAGGDLAYLSAGEDQAELQLDWIEHSGKRSPLDIGNPYFFQLAFGPDSNHLAGIIPAANDKIFVYDFQRKIMTRLTNTPGNDTLPIWSPNGRQIVYINDRDGSADLYIIPADGSTSARRILASPEDEFPKTFSPDGTQILFTRVLASGKAEICTMPVDGSSEPLVLFPSDQSNWNPTISRDGKWIAYITGSREESNIYARRFDGQGRPVRISPSGGGNPQWSPDGKTIFYIADEQMMAAPINTDSGFSVGTPYELFDIGTSVFGEAPMAPNGERFLVNNANPQLRKHFGIRVVFAWTEKLAGI
jgi:WD40 repeat protein/predicted Ser/Thr protein kinase